LGKIKKSGALDGIKEIRFFQKIGFLALTFHPIWVKLEKSGALDGIKEIRFFEKIGFLALTFHPIWVRVRLGIYPAVLAYCYQKLLQLSGICR